MLFRIYIFFFGSPLHIFVCVIWLKFFWYILCYINFFIFTSLVFNVMNVYDYVHLLNQNEIPGKNSNPK